MDDNIEFLLKATNNYNNSYVASNGMIFTPLFDEEGAVQDSIVDVNYNTARKIQKEVENFHYEMITKRMSAEAAKEQAAAMIDKIAKDYELGKGRLSNENQKNLREWIFGGINQLSEIIGSLSKFKQAESLLKRLEKVIRKPNE